MSSQERKRGVMSGDQGDRNGQGDNGVSTRAEDAAGDFSARVIHWQQQEGRHDLPWQGTRDPYRVWLSEIMLQQTQVVTVVAYYTRFLARFPDVATLAASPVDAVLELWAGLGYYARARNLHRCARVLMEKHGGHFPRDPAEIAELPGIGRSTAAAIAAFSFGTRAAILDGNVKRVLARCFAIEGFPGAAAVERTLWVLADRLLPQIGIEAYTQGLMDLGATVCVRGQPFCPPCPLYSLCQARGQGRQAELPVARPRKQLPEREAVLAVVDDGAGVLLLRRPPSGIWGGLLVLPSVEELHSLLIQLGLEFKQGEALPEFRHTFSHFHLWLRPRRYRMASHILLLLDASSAWVWLPWGEIDTAALPTPIRRLLRGVRPSTSTV